MPGATPVVTTTGLPLNALVLPVVGALLLAAAAIYFLVRGLGLKAIRDERSFDLMVLLAVLILPQLAAIPVRLIGGNPLDYTSPNWLWRDLAFIIPLTLASLGIGLWWKPSVYLPCMGMFYALFVVFYKSDRSHVVL